MDKSNKKVIVCTINNSVNALRDYDYILFYIKKRLMKLQQYMIRWRGYIEFNPYGTYYTLYIHVEHEDDYKTISILFKEACDELDKEYRKGELYGARK